MRTILDFYVGGVEGVLLAFAVMVIVATFGLCVSEAFSALIETPIGICRLWILRLVVFSKWLAGKAGVNWKRH